MTNEKATRYLFNNIGVKIQFPSEKQDGTIPFKFLGVINDYNDVDIIQTPDYIEMICTNYILWLLKSYGWDTPSPKLSPNENIAFPKDTSPPDQVPTSLAAASLIKVQVLQRHGVPILPAPTEEEESKSCINTKHPKVDSSDIMHSSKPINPLPSDCIE